MVRLEAGRPGAPPGCQPEAPQTDSALTVDPAQPFLYLQPLTWPHPMLTKTDIWL